MPKYRKALRFLLILFLLCLLIGLIHVVSALTIDRKIQYLEVPFTSPQVDRFLDGYRITFITDTHQIPADQLRTVVDEVNARGTDLVLLGGDYPSGDAAWRTMEILSGIESTHGIYGVEGNHDVHTNLFPAMEANGIHVLSNSGVSIRPNLFVSGVEDLWNRNPDVAQSVVGTEPDDFVLLVSHNPDVTMQQDMSSVDLTLSGHTHGGQATFFGLWAPALSSLNDITDYGQRFRTGLCYNDSGHPVYVSNGAGFLAGVPRVFAPPQVITIVLRYNPEVIILPSVDPK